MKKRKLRPVGLLLAVLLTVSMLTGCHDAPAKAEQTQPQDNTEATVAQNAAQETTQQTEATNPKDEFWVVTDEDSVMNSVVHTGVKSEGWEKNSTQLPL